MTIDSQNLSQHSAYELLEAAARGMVAIDQRWLHALIDQPEKTLPDIVRFAAEDRSMDRIPLEQDLVSIFQYLKTPLGIPYFIDLILANPEDIPDEVVEALVQIGEPSVEPLLKAYEEIGVEHGGEVAFLLAGLSIKKPEVLELLLNRLNIDWEDALFHLEVYHDPAAIPELEKLLESETDEERKLDLNDTISDLREERPASQIENFDIWELYPDEAVPPFEVLDEEERLEFLSSTSADLRAEAATSFFGEEYSSDVESKLLELAHSDPAPEVRACCWEAFFDHTEDPELRRVMMERLSNPETPNLELAGLVLGLARHTDQAVVHRTVLKLAKDPETRERAVEAMWRSFDESFGPEAIKYVDDPDQEVRRNVIWAIGYLQMNVEAGQLPKFFEDEELRDDALHNYALVATGTTTKKKIPELYTKIEVLAKGLTEGEAQAVRAGLDVRLVRAGMKPFYDKEEEDEPESVPAQSDKVGRNDPCPCGSGKKYKKCHGG